MIHHSRPWVTEEDIAAVTATLRRGHLSAGQQVFQFEDELAKVVSASGGVATSSGTAALHLALLALGVGDDDEVVLPTYVCSAVLNAVHHCRATPVMCDVDPETGNLDPAGLRRLLTKRTKAIVVVHLFGHPAELDWVQEIGIPVVEDCAQALGASWHGRPVGGIGAVSVFSFYATKVITTGEGGMACSSSSALLDRMRSLRDYDNQGQYEVRYSYSMSDMQASLGLAQAARLPGAIARRRDLTARYDAVLNETGVQLPPRRDGCDPIFYRYVIQTRRAEELMAKFSAQSVEVKRPVFRPLHHYLKGSARLCPGADAIYSRALSLPLYPALSDDEATRVVEVALNVLQRHSSMEYQAVGYYAA